MNGKCCGTAAVICGQQVKSASTDIRNAGFTWLCIPTDCRSNDSGRELLIL